MVANPPNPLPDSPNALEAILGPLAGLVDVGADGLPRLRDRRTYPQAVDELFEAHARVFVGVTIPQRQQARLQVDALRCLLLNSI